MVVIRLASGMRSEILLDVLLDLKSPFVPPGGESRFFSIVKSNGADGILVVLYEESGQAVLMIRER